MLVFINSNLLEKIFIFDANQKNMSSNDQVTAIMAIIKDQIKTSDLSGVEIAKKIGISKSSLYNCLNGKQDMSLKSFLELLNILDLKKEFALIFAND